MENVEHRVEAVGGRQLLVVGSDAELAVRVDVHIRDVHFRLVSVDVVYFRLIENHLPLVDVDERFLFGGGKCSHLVLAFALFAENKGDASLILSAVCLN